MTARIYHRTTNVKGRKIFYREAGDPAAPTILLLHGLPTSSQMFRDLMPALADRFHPLRMTLATLCLYVLVMLWGGFYARDTATFAIAFVAHGVISGAYFTASAALGQRLLPRARFSELMSAGGIFSCLCSIALAPCIGMLLDHTGHNYRYTFYAGGGITMAAVVVTLLMHGKFMALGGPRNYVAPE